VLLINPPYLQVPGRFAKQALYFEPPLGLAYLAAMLEKQRKNVQVEILDAAALGLDFEQIIKHIEDCRPDMVGATSVTYTSNFTKKLFREIKTVSPCTLTVTGGPHPSALPTDLLPESDICVVGEGEETICEIVDYLDGKKSLQDIKGISYQTKDGNKINPARPFIKDIDSIPYPARHLLPMDKYSYQYPYKTKTPYYTTILGARGCPYGCTFCGSKKMWGREPRFRSASNIIGELTEVAEKYRVSFVNFYDDTFAARRKQAVALCQGIIEEGLDIQWSTTTRVDVLDKELLRLMKRAGCVEIQAGVETGDPKIMKVINKGITLEQVVEAFKLFKSEGIQTKAFFMIGNQGETEETIKRTIDFALRIDPTYAFFSVLLPFPGLPVYEEYRQRGYIKTLDWGNYNFHREPVFETDTLSKEDLIRLRRTAELKFFLRPKKISKYLLDAVKAEKLGILKRNFFAFLNIILG
jgi:anaerobic magnesium-protoporphyrin IX monomethyl ester cyclase